MEKACGLDRETAQESIDGFLIAKDRCKLGSRSSGLPRSHDDFIQRMTSTWEGWHRLSIDFGNKMGGKIEPRSICKDIEKTQIEQQ